MNLEDFRKKHNLREYALVFVPLADACPAVSGLEKGGVIEVYGHPSFERILAYEIVKYHKTWVLLGKAVCAFFESTTLDECGKEVNFEIALSLDKYQLLIWKDLHCV